MVGLQSTGEQVGARTVLSIYDGISFLAVDVSGWLFLETQLTKWRKFTFWRHFDLALLEELLRPDAVDGNYEYPCTIISCFSSFHIFLQRHLQGMTSRTSETINT